MCVILSTLASVSVCILAQVTSYLLCTFYIKMERNLPLWFILRLKFSKASTNSPRDLHCKTFDLLVTDLLFQQAQAIAAAIGGDLMCFGVRKEAREKRGTGRKFKCRLSSPIPALIGHPGRSKGLSLLLQPGFSLAPSLVQTLRLTQLIFNGHCRSLWKRDFLWDAVLKLPSLSYIPSPPILSQSTEIISPFDTNLCAHVPLSPRELILTVRTLSPPLFMAGASPSVCQVKCAREMPGECDCPWTSAIALGGSRVKSGKWVRIASRSGSGGPLSVLRSLPFHPDFSFVCLPLPCQKQLLFAFLLGWSIFPPSFHQALPES